MQLDALFKQPQALPAVPKIVHELIDSFNSEDISIDDIAKKIAADPVLSARLLRLANSDEACAAAGFSKLARQVGLTKQPFNDQR